MSREGNERAYYATIGFIDRFENDRRCLRECCWEYANERFTDKELTSLLLLLYDLKSIYEGWNKEENDD